MANPGDLSVMVALDRIDALVKTIGGIMVRLEAAEERIAVLQAIRRIDAALTPETDIALIRDSMNRSALGGGE